MPFNTYRFLFFVTIEDFLYRNPMSKKILDGIETHIELDGFVAANYDLLMNLLSLGMYPRFIHRAMASLGIKTGDKVLDLGCGTGRNLALIAKHAGPAGQLYGLDLGEKMLTQAKQRFRNQENIHIAQGSILESFPFQTNFDHVTISFVLHGLSHSQRLTLAEIVFHHLKAGAMFTILDWWPEKIKNAPFWFKPIFKAIECPMAFEFIEHDYTKEFSDYGFRYEGSTAHLLGFARVIRLTKE
ncbi:MAG TPA: methyltransferase domain-containing protein [Candidatus Marinimicrobia bacterium]|nr:methyltransferase domain-containing protein [Candidatus Neomarinimicrobiota bacterium]